MATRRGVRLCIMAREGLLGDAPGWCGPLVRALAEHAIRIGLEEKVVMASIGIRSGLGGGDANVKELVKLHRALASLYAPDEDWSDGDAEREARMMREFEKVPEIFTVRTGGDMKPIEGEFSFGG